MQLSANSRHRLDIVPHVEFRIGGVMFSSLSIIPNNFLSHHEDACHPVCIGGYTLGFTHLDIL